MGRGVWIRARIVARGRGRRVRGHARVIGTPKSGRCAMTSWNDRVARDGTVLHWHGTGLYSVGAPDQCEFEGCRGTRATRSRHCLRHAR